MYVDLNGDDGTGIYSNLLTAIPAELPSEPSPAFLPSSHLLVQTMPGACQTGPRNTTPPSFPVKTVLTVLTSKTELAKQLQQL